MTSSPARRFYPSYPLAPVQAVNCRPWLANTGVSEAPLGPIWPHWDYNTRVRIGRALEVDVDQLRTSCHVTSRRSLRLAVTWRSTATQLRGVAVVMPLPNSGNAAFAVTAELPSNEIGGDVMVWTQILVGGDRTTEDGSLAPQYSGSVLWQEERRIRVEGGAGRFPVELIDFTTTRIPDRAAWVLSWDQTDFHAPVLASMRLLVNSSHSVVAKAVTTTTPDPADHLVRSVIKYDVARTLVNAALKDSEFLANPDQYDDGSVGRELRRLLRAYFGTEEIESIAARAMSFPAEFQAELQHLSSVFR